MKKIITIIAVLFSTVASAQIADSTKCGYVVNISPIKVKFTDSLKSQYLKAVIIGDDMATSATFYYQILDSNCTCNLDGNVTINGEAYHNWSGNSGDAYILIADKIGVAIKK